MRFPASCHFVRGFLALAAGIAISSSRAAEPFDAHGRIRVAASGTHLEHADGTPFFFLADTCWTGPALSEEKDWDEYLADRRKKGFTAIQFNMASPWRCARTDAEGRPSYLLRDGKLVVNEEFYAARLDARLRAINQAGLLAVPVLCWANHAGDAGIDLTEEQIITLVRYEVSRYEKDQVLWILGGDNDYKGPNGERWKRIGRTVFGQGAAAPVTTHPTGQNWPWKDWQDEMWLTVFGYQSGHGDGDGTWNWIHHGPPAEAGRSASFSRPIINLEAPYEGHLAYQSHQPHSDANVRRAVWWSLLVTPVAGVTYGSHGVWSWNTKPGQAPTDHPGTGPAPTWREALDRPGARQVGLARRFFECLPWTKLRPAPQLLASQEKEASKFIACAATPDHGVIVAYVPAGAKPQVALDQESGPGWVTRWFDPRSGDWKPGSPLPPTATDDWVFLRAAEKEVKVPK